MGVELVWRESTKEPREKFHVAEWHFAHRKEEVNIKL